MLAAGVVFVFSSLLYDAYLYRDLSLLFSLVIASSGLNLKDKTSSIHHSSIIGYISLQEYEYMIGFILFYFCRNVTK